MQTTLRIETALYRQAKTEAARQGITLTQFIHEALILRLKAPLNTGPVQLPSFRGGPDVAADFDLSSAMKEVQDSSDRLVTRRLLSQ